MAKVFLSYAREDAAAAKQLAECIGHAGHQVWWDHQIEGGSRFSAEIDRELKNCDAVVVMWTAASIESPWVQDEAAEGRDSDRLLPLAIDDSLPPLGFRQFHAIDLARWNGRSS
ncbi:MAG: toll/interleukin-1 receptor domain-containing protein, partial [Sphingomicrobium sp.]